VTVEGVKKKTFDGDRMLGKPVLATSAAGGADLDPVGGSINGTSVPAGIDKGFKEKRSHLIATGPIIRKAMDRQ